MAEARSQRIKTVIWLTMRAGIRLPGGADGIYGPYTEAAVEVYQRRHGIPISGIVYRPTALVMGIYRLPPPPLT
jgi:peptidoglycan hydrolase-like protein with peptidoglycan-binding domain